MQGCEEEERRDERDEKRRGEGGRKAGGGRQKGRRAVKKVNERKRKTDRMVVCLEVWLEGTMSWGDNTDTGRAACLT